MHDAQSRNLDSLIDDVLPWHGSIAHRPPRTHVADARACSYLLVPVVVACFTLHYSKQIQKIWDTLVLSA
jgi:hypothetical protein